jgi:hypothetical protein
MHIHLLMPDLWTFLCFVLHFIIDRWYVLFALTPIFMYAEYQNTNIVSILCSIFTVFDPSEKMLAK